MTYKLIMTLNHIGIINKTKEDALRFYKDLLGFELTRESVIPQELAERSLQKERLLRSSFKVLRYSFR